VISISFNYLITLVTSNILSATNVLFSFLIWCDGTSCLPCGHLYGYSCINKWFQQRRSGGKVCGCYVVVQIPLLLVDMVFLLIESHWLYL